MGDYSAGGTEAVALAFEVSSVRTDWVGGERGLAWLGRGREGGGAVYSLQTVVLHVYYYECGGAG